MNKFPIELLKLTFSYLPHDGLGECMRVCKSWYPLASERKYEEFKAYPASNQYMQQLQSTRFDGSKAIDFVKICTFGYWAFQEDDFLALMACLPNIRIIQRIPPRYLGFLDENALDHLTRLEKILMNDSSYSLRSVADLYFDINIYLKNQITSLTLVPSSLTSYQGQYKRLIETLSGFPTLKNLRIYRCPETLAEDINLTSILNACNSLTSLELQNSCTWEIDTDSNVIHKSLSSLKLSVSNLTENHLKYMIQHLPNLKKFTLAIQRTSFEGVLYTVNPSIIDDFALYSKKLDYFEIEQSTSPSSRNNDIYNSSQVLLFWEFIHDLCGENCYCTLVTRALSSVERPSCTQLRKQDRIVFLRCDVLLDPSNYESFVQQLNFFTFRSIKFIYDSTQETDNAHYTQVIQPVVALLEYQQQRHNQSSVDCCFYNGTTKQEVKFDENCCISRFVLETGLLEILGQLLYPLAETLELKRCSFKEDGYTVGSFKLDLSQFVKVQHLTFDLDRLFPTIILPLYINFISVAHETQSAKYYRYREDENALYYLGENNEPIERGPYYVVNIYHTGIKGFTFKRLQRTIHALIE